MSQTLPVATKLMIIRHAEKPPQPPLAPPPFGITADGNQDPESLTARGWQRAGALVSFFCPPQEGVRPNKAIALPAFVYISATKPASDNGKTGSKSKRPEETVTPLLEKLGAAAQRNLTFTKGEEETMIQSAMGCSGVVLISWQHEKIPVIGQFIPTNPATPVPQEWPNDPGGNSRYDLVWVFDLDPTTHQYAFKQLFQNLLAGDLPH